MAYSINQVPTLATGDTWTADQHNIYLRDNFRSIIPNVFDGAGDMMISVGANQAEILNVGNDYSLFRVISGGYGVGWKTYPLSAYVKTGNNYMSIPSNTSTLITGLNNHVVYEDIPGMVGNSSIAFMAVGFYLVGIALYWDQVSAGGGSTLSVWVDTSPNGTHGQSIRSNDSADINWQSLVFVEGIFGAGSVAFRVEQFSGGALNINSVSIIVIKL